MVRDFYHHRPQAPRLPQDNYEYQEALIRRRFLTLLSRQASQCEGRQRQRRIPAPSRGQSHPIPSSGEVTTDSGREYADRNHDFDQNEQFEPPDLNPPGSSDDHQAEQEREQQAVSQQPPSPPPPPPPYARYRLVYIPMKKKQRPRQQRHGQQSLLRDKLRGGLAKLVGRDQRQDRNVGRVQAGQQHAQQSASTRDKAILLCIHLPKPKMEAVPSIHAGR